MITLLSVLLRVFPASSFMNSRSGGGCATTNKFLRVKQHKFLRVKQHPQLHLIDRSCDNIIASYTGTQRHRLSWKCYSTNEPNDNQCDEKNEDIEQKQLQVEVTADSLTPSQIQSLSPDSQSSFWGALKSFFSNKKNKFSRESLGKMGMSALLAYGFVSNVSGVIAVSCAWFIFSKRVSVLCLCYLGATLNNNYCIISNKYLRSITRLVSRR